ncbi:shikimate dehydrogenase [Bifidobacterium sp. ESL0764]|uniref:shikimate dehydrogenase family protein n=1 Tax=Bifidobacterium sp. ESL0764 TaxID=2983228 RepID=UPI0023F92CCB|nr:shikimate dehydrogenase [Bifidobacterium sp. ESL0764]WEV65070.1 shikimate dehydrogenase [Bifidobacterium sp. ESL0764]
MINGINHRCAVLGKPISHSLSPVLHNAAYKALGLGDWYYDRVEVGEEDLDGFLKSLDPSWAGLSLTMPLKRTIQPYGTPADIWSRRLHVANTAVFSWNKGTDKPDIRLYNTDVEGIIQAFSHCWQLSEKKKFESQNPEFDHFLSGTSMTAVSPDTSDNNSAGKPERTGAKAVILGNGNTALSALAACTEIKVPGKGAVTDVTVCARHQHDHDPMKQLAESRDGFGYQQVPLGEAPRYLAQADIVINTIPAHGADESAGKLADFLDDSSNTFSSGTLLDVVYDPRPTNLMQVWRSHGGTAIGGEEMLLYQAIAQVRLMTVGAHIIGTADFEQAMRNALQEAL